MSEQMEHSAGNWAGGWVGLGQVLGPQACQGDYWTAAWWEGRPSECHMALCCWCALQVFAVFSELVAGTCQQQDESGSGGER